MTITIAPTRVNLGLVHSIRFDLSVLFMGSTSSDKGYSDLGGFQLTYLFGEKSEKIVFFPRFLNFDQALSQSVERLSPDWNNFNDAKGSLDLWYDSAYCNLTSCLAKSLSSPYWKLHKRWTHWPQKKSLGNWEVTWETFTRVIKHFWYFKTNQQFSIWTFVCNNPIGTHTYWRTKLQKILENQTPKVNY